MKQTVQFENFSSKTLPQAFSRSMDSPTLKLDVLFKDNDKSVDIKLETDKGVSETNDQAVSFPIFGGPLRNLRFDNIRSSLVSRHLIGNYFIHFFLGGGGFFSIF